MAEDDSGTGVLDGKEKRALLFRNVTSIVVLAWAVRVVSVFNILNALLRYQPKLIFWLGKWVPFEISEGHRIRIFLMSVLLFILASGLQRGKSLAWRITIAGLLLAPILHLGRGAIWPQAVVNLALIAAFFSCIAATLWWRPIRNPFDPPWSSVPCWRSRS